ncbi:hypothetical protein RLIN73S_04622 [Rhodanobacter lindaniclasticus]
MDRLDGRQQFAPIPDVAEGINECARRHLRKVGGLGRVLVHLLGLPRPRGLAAVQQKYALERVHLADRQRAPTYTRGQA